jgi:hypothetical protein
MMVELEGTWEEILAHAPELAGKRVRLTVLEGVDATPENGPAQPGRELAAWLRELEESDKEMPFTPAGDTVAIIREGRAGAMYGYEPAE